MFHGVISDRTRKSIELQGSFSLYRIDHCSRGHDQHDFRQPISRGIQLNRSDREHRSSVDAQPQIAGIL